MNLTKGILIEIVNSPMTDVGPVESRDLTKFTPPGPPAALEFGPSFRHSVGARLARL